MPAATRRLDRFALVVLIGALALRVGIMLTTFATAETYSGDGQFYIRIASEPWRLGMPRDEPVTLEDGRVNWPRERAVTSTGPVYPALLIPSFNLIPDRHPVIQYVSVRLLQAVLDTLTAWLIYLMAYHLFGQRAARLAIVMQALDLRYIFTAGTIATETVFITLFTAFMLITVLAAAQGRVGLYRLAGLLLGLALLTRPVPLLYPLLLAAAACLHPSDRKGAARGAAWLLAVMLLVITPWVIRTSILAGEFVPISDSGFVHLWRNSRGDGDALSTSEALAEAAGEDLEYGEVDPNTEGDEYVGAALRNILAEPLEWGLRVGGRLAAAYLQPYGTVIGTPTGAGVRHALRAFLSGEGTLGDVLAVPALGRRLLMYVWHYWGLMGGVAGGLLVWRRWRDLFPLAAWVGYISAIMLFLLVEPRYLLPVMFVFTLLAAHATVVAWDALKARGWLPRTITGTRPAA